MTLLHIGVFCAAALLYALLPGRGRGWALMLGSVVAVYWLQPTLPVRWLDFALPTATLALTVLVWLATREGAFTRADAVTAGVVVVTVLALSATRYLIPELRPTASRAPGTPSVAAALIALGGLLALMVWLLRGRRGALLWGCIIFIIGLFIVLKTPPLTVAASAWLRAQTGQSTDLAAVTDLGWLGFSYVAFRLLHTLRDRQTGRLPALSLREHLTYVVFFPALTAGPIDRAERFVKDDRALTETRILDANRVTVGLTRVAVGMFKKFVVADSLALLSLNATTAAQTESAWGLWLLLYVYSFRLFFDFSGYTDIAIGIGCLFGITLPENFNRPYLKNNLAAFWQSWHITLSDWVRFYVFSPLSRWLIRHAKKLPTLSQVFIAQMATMLVIGLWHGVTWTFVVWGAWHGVGLFVHKAWSNRTRKWYMRLKDKPRTKQGWTVAGVVITFHYVTLGWVWFALPDIGLAWRVLLGLFGL